MKFKDPILSEIFDNPREVVKVMAKLPQCELKDAHCKGVSVSE